jgi:hypothetical protein
MRLLQTLIVLCLCGCLGACSGLREKVAPTGGPTFATANASGFLTAQALPPAEDSGPIMRVIKGEPVDDVAEALREMSERSHAAGQGLDARISSLMLRDVSVETSPNC